MSRISIYWIILFLMIVGFGTVPTAAQGGGGRSSGGKPPETPKPTPTPTPKGTDSGRTGRGTQGGKGSPTPPPVIKNGGLQVFLNDAPAEVSIVGGNIVQSGPFRLDAGAFPWRVDDLKPGKYLLTIRKEGYTELRREAIVRSGESTRIEITLNPIKSFLSVAVQPPDAKIEISNLGNFTGRTGQILVDPGSYEAVVARPGYITERRSFQIDKVGEKREITISLSPLRTDQVLSEASEKLNNAQYAEAIRMAKLIIDNDPNIGKAFAISGKGKFLSGAGGASDLITAINKGEKITLNARRHNRTGKENQLLAGMLTIDSNYIEFVASQIPAQSFSIFKPEITEISLRRDESGSTFIALKGTGTFGGKKRTESVNIYPATILVRGDRKQTFCSDCSGTTCRCETWINELRELIIMWRRPK